MESRKGVWCTSCAPFPCGTLHNKLLPIRQLMVSSPLAAGIGTAPSANHSPAQSGLKTVNPRFSIASTSTSSLRCRKRLPRLFFRTKKQSTAFSSGPRRRLCAPSPPIPNISAPKSGFSPCFTPGARICSRILTHDAWHYHLLCFHQITYTDFAYYPLQE